MRQFFVILLFAIFTLTSFAQDQWAIQANGLPSLPWNIWCMDASSSQFAVIGGCYSNIYSTTDSGNSWHEKDYSFAAGNSDEKTVDISMVDKDHIWLCTKDKILRSLDGGNSWQVQSYTSNIAEELVYIKMFDQQNGVAVGDAIPPSQSAVILKTSDGGLHWNSVNTQSFGAGPRWQWRGVSFVNPMVGYMFESGIDPRKLYKTVDGGAHWDTTNYSSISDNSLVLKFYDENIGFTFNFGKICYTLDGGQTWSSTTIFSPYSYWGMDIGFIKNNNSIIVAAATDDCIFFSADTGKTWTSDTTFHKYGVGIIEMRFPDKDHGWLLAGSGSPQQVFYKGSSLVISGLENQNNLPQNFSLSQNYPNPFNPSTNIRYSLQQKGFVKIKVYDMLGREVRALINEEQSAGQHEINFNAGGLPSGIYFYKISTGSSSIVKKMILMK